ncbi:AAA family ATPase [Thermoanaerobacterium sp. DL9XJH110]|uniref:AAA family ATPase n=1 Tax=Thermoanaerobacterium sp. DL9XJH110 TaxID=3386643 RepID=UPI003BB57AF6
MTADKGRVITWWSAGGGVGKTVLAVAQALALAKRSEKVALLDFKEGMPHIHKVLDIELQDLAGIYDAAERGVLSADVVKGYMREKRGLRVLTGIPMEEFERFKGRHFSAIIGALRGEFEHIIVDTNAGVFFSSTEAALRESDGINVVLLPDKISLEDTAQMVEFVCDRWGIRRGKVEAFLNKYDRDGIDPETVERVLGFNTKAVPYDGRLKDLSRPGIIRVLKDMAHVFQVPDGCRKDLGRRFIKVFSGGKVIPHVADKSV